MSSIIGNRKIFITGSTGFVGNNLIHHLLKDRNNFVLALVRSKQKLNFPNDPNLKIIFGDLTKPWTYNNFLDGVEVIVNVAGVVTDWAKKEDYYAVHVQGVKDLIESGINWDVKKIIHISSVAVLEKNMQDVALTEETSLTKSTIPYDQTKRKGEEILFDYCGLINIISLRPGWIYGPGDTTLFPEIAHQTKKGQMVLVHSRDVKIPLVHIHNLCLTIVKSIEANIECDSFLISDGEITWGELCSKIARRIGGKEPKLIIPFNIANVLGLLMELMGHFLHKKNRPLLTRTAAEMLGVSIVMDTSKAKKILGYKSEIQIEQGIEDTLTWLRYNEIKRIK